MKKANRQMQHHEPQENASENLSLKTNTERSRKNLRRMKVKTRKRKITVMPVMKVSPKQLQAKA